MVFSVQALPSPWSSAIIWASEDACMHGLIFVDVTPKPILGFNFDSHASHQPRHVNNRKRRKKDPGEYKVCNTSRYTRQGIVYSSTQIYEVYVRERECMSCLSSLEHHTTPPSPPPPALTTRSQPGPVQPWEADVTAASFLSTAWQCYWPPLSFALCHGNKQDLS